jgi:hypothetical protein
MDEISKPNNPPPKTGLVSARHPVLEKGVEYHLTKGGKCTEKVHIVYLHHLAY